jgi:hypothetical protein
LIEFQNNSRNFHFAETSSDLMHSDTSREVSSPLSPDSLVDETEFTQPISSERLSRDQRRKDIEARAAVKRKQAIRRLSLVLAARTHGLPEAGLANQLTLAADKLE